jgi:MFS family permease
MFAVAFALAGAVSGYTYQASIFFTLEEVSEKGKGSGFHEAIIGFGMAAGPLLAGWVGNATSMRSPYFFCAGAVALLVVTQIVLVFARRNARLRT